MENAVNKQPSKVLVIGGSFITTLEGLDENKKHNENYVTPYGKACLIPGKIGGKDFFFLNRHERGHTLTPSEVNYAANIYAAKMVGATTVVSVCAVGSLQHGIEPGLIGLVNDYVDQTRGIRRSTFFGKGIVAHVSPVPAHCPEAYRVTADVARKLLPASSFHEGGIEVVMEGLPFSTRAESFKNQGCGYQYIGMTAMPEAFLAMEAELCHITLVVVTDYDAWKIGRAVNVAEVGRVFTENGPKVQGLIRKLIPELSVLPRTCLCPSRLEHAIQTDPRYVTPEVRRRLAPIIGRLLPTPPESRLESGLKDP